MRKIYFIIPIFILIIGLLQLFFFHSQGSGKVTLIYAKIEKPAQKINPLNLNVSNVIILVVNNTGKEAVAICYIKDSNTTIPFNDIYVIFNRKPYGDSIPPRVNNLTILVNASVEIPFSIYLSNTQTLSVNS